MSFSNNSSINNISSFINNKQNENEISSTSNPSLSRLNEIIDKEDSKTKLYSRISNNVDNSVSQSIQFNNTKTKEEALDNIHRLLEENEKNDLTKMTTNKNLQKKYDASKGLSSQFNQLNIRNNNITDILSLTLELTELKKTNAMMKETIDDLKSQMTKMELDHKEEMDKKLNEQQFSNDGTIQRLNDLVQNLLSEKKKLNGVIDSLNDQLGEIDLKYKKKIQSIKEGFDSETQKNKDAWFQAEKKRRKKWEEDKLKELKEMTVKSLEPELDAILKKHKKELSDQEDMLKENYRAMKEKMIIEYETKIRKIKENFEKEKDEIVDKERQEYSKRLREQNERMEDQHSEDQKKWYVSLQDEITRLETLRKKDKVNYEKDLELMQIRHNKDIEEKEEINKENLAKIKANLEEKFRNEIQVERNLIEKEKEIFLENKEREYNTKLEKEKVKLTEERDKKLNNVIKQLTDDMVNDKNKAKKEIESKANIMNINLIKQNEELKDQITSLKNDIISQKELYEKLNSQYEKSLGDIEEKEKETLRLNREISSLNQLLSELQDKLASVNGEYSQKISDINVNYQTQIDKIISEQRLQKEKSEIIVKNYESKINDINNEHRAEMETLELKIKKTLNRKDETITRLNNEILVKNQTIKKYEELLTKQRNEFISNYHK